MELHNVVRCCTLRLFSFMVRVDAESSKDTRRLPFANGLFKAPPKQVSRLQCTCALRIAHIGVAQRKGSSSEQSTKDKHKQSVC